MSIYKRKGSRRWWYEFQIEGIGRVRESSGTENESDAEQAEAKRKRELWQQVRLDVKPSKLWEAAVVDYLKEMPDGRNKEFTKGQLRFADALLRGKAVAEIDKGMLLALRAAKQASINEAKRARAELLDHHSRWPTAQPSTINRFLGCVGAVLHHADQPIRVPFLEVPRKEKPWASREKALKLIAGLPRHQIAMVIFGLEVGWRRHNVTHLEWGQVDLDRRFAWVTPEAAKAGCGIPAPLSDMAVEVLRGQLGKHERWVFPYRGKAVEQTSTKAYRRARDAAGLPPEFTWHSLRHTWASWHRQGGTPQAVLQDLGGWKDARMVANYAHLGADHLTAYVKGHSGIDSSTARAALRAGNKNPHSAQQAEEGKTENP